MKRWHKALILSLMGGDLYCMVELIWRGHTHWSMFLLAAMLSLPLDLANEHMAWERPLWLQALIGGSVITLAELGAGLILNVWLKLDIWDYSRLPGNLWGQVCLKYALLWVVLAGTAIVLFDWMRHWLFQEERPHYLDLRGGMQDRNGGALRADRRGGYRTGGWGGIPLPEECQAGRCPGGAPGYGEQAGYGSDVRHLFVVPDHGQKVGGSTYQRRRGGGHACSGDGPHGVYRLRPQRGGPQRQ